MKKSLLSLLLMMCTINVCAQEDSIKLNSDTTAVLECPNKPNRFKKFAHSFIGFFTADPDTNYIEPQKYNWTVMAQGTMTHDYFELKGDNDYKISFSPTRNFKLGPFFGWRWLFLGYTFNINTLLVSSNNLDINTTLYTPAFGVDFLLRNLGDGYEINSMELGDFDATNGVKGMEVDGLDIHLLSINAYYILNKRHYSHQAAFNQTNRQLRSAGSWIVGVGYNNCRVKMDWDDFKSQVARYTYNDPQYAFNDSSLLFKSIGYKSMSTSVGYGYNWVFAKNWLAGIQVLGSLSYMWSSGEHYEEGRSIGQIFHDFSFSNFTFDGTIRAGIVWNNSKWFAGTSAIYHTYHYHQTNLQSDNIFAQFNIYAGYNFGRKK